MSSIPGAAVATTSMMPLAASRLETRFSPCASRYSPSASGAVIVITSIDVSANNAVSTGLPSSSTASTRSPASAAARARTAVTVVLPTPPFPATMTSRAAPKNCSESTRPPEALLRRLAIIFLAVAAVVGLFSAVGSANAAGSTNASGVRGAAATADAPGVDLAPVDVVQVSGLIDEILVDEIQTAIRRSESDGAQALILQMNSGGAVVSRDRMEDLMQSVAESKVPIGIWVGPSGASLTGLGAQLLAVADATGMA